MNIFTRANISTALFAYDSFTDLELDTIIQTLNTSFSYSSYLQQVTMKKRALLNQKNAQTSIASATQEFPIVINSQSITPNPESLKNCAIVITAGGEGERLRVSLEELGYSSDQLKDFTKATFPIPDTEFTSGALEVNLTGIKKLILKAKYDIPVVVTTGPSGSTTADIIPRILKENKNFGIKNLRVIEQEERLHLTIDDKIVVTHWEDSMPFFATNPDETGGPLEKLRQGEENSTLSWLQSLGVKKILILQGTAIYAPTVIPTIAAASLQFEVMGVGISRNTFPTDDPYGTFVILNTGKNKKLVIAEKDVRSKKTEELYDVDQKIFLPFNTGFYAINLNTLEENNLPDYASPAKIIAPGMHPSPKVGYAATHILEFSEKSGVLTLPQESFKVIKNADDLVTLSQTVKQFNLSK